MFYGKQSLQSGKVKYFGGHLCHIPWWWRHKYSPKHWFLLWIDAAVSLKLLLLYWCYFIKLLSGKSCRYGTGLQIGWSGFDSRWGLGIFLFTTMSRMALGSTQPPIQRVQGALSLEVKWLGHEADHSSPSSAEVKEWVELYFHSPNTPSWHGAQLKHRDTFTFTERKKGNNFKFPHFGKTIKKMFIALGFLSSVISRNYGTVNIFILQLFNLFVIFMYFNFMN
jgi:hypothetical protein